MLTPEQVTALQQPIDSDRVKQRRQSGRLVSYLEGYDVIDHANGIFGFDGWSYSVQNVEFVRMGDVAFYQATVKVWVSDVERTDVGFCDVVPHRDRGLDGASADSFGTALKGAVTDGLKRALRTFGSQFGNSLYDKDDPAHTAQLQSHGDGPTLIEGGRPAYEQVSAARSETGSDTQPCPTCGSAMYMKSGTTRDGRPYTAWFCGAKCGQKPIWLNERKAS